MIQKQTKAKPKIKVERENLSNILSQGAMKNKEEMEQLLSTHGGGFKTDFGLRGTIDFGENENSQGWNKLVGYISGNVQDERIQETIEERKNNRGHYTVKKSKLEPISPRSPQPVESLTDITKAFLDTVKQK